jgi:hypothetical protein
MPAEPLSSFSKLDKVLMTAEAQEAMHKNSLHKPMEVLPM